LTVTLALGKPLSAGNNTKFCSILADICYANAYILATLNLYFQVQTILKRKANILDDYDRLYLVICNSIRQ